MPGGIRDGPASRRAVGADGSWVARRLRPAEPLFFQVERKQRESRRARTDMQWYKTKMEDLVGT